MIEYLWFALKVSVCLSVFYLFFAALLKHSTFFKLNRIYLLAGLFLSFAIPTLKFSIFSVQSTSVLSDVIEIVSIEPENAFFQQQNITNGFTTVSFSAIISAIYIVGVSILLLKLLLSIIRVMREKNNADASRIGRIKIFKTDYPIPFSFLNVIFLPRNVNDPLIVEHEIAHVKQAHWFDLIVMEIASLLLWFNPFVAFYKSSLKLQHEYLADSGVVNDSVLIEPYLYCMLAQVNRVSIGGLTSQFYCKTIKKRIIMITKNKTSIKYFGVYFLALPLVCLMLFAFTSSNNKGSIAISKTGLIVPDGNKPSIYPVDAKKVTQVYGYGERMNPMTKKKDFHYGIDFAAKEGVEVMATANGVVVEAKFDNEKGMGNYVIIKHNDVYSTLFSHLKNFNVKAGDVLKIGQVIGYVGSTGVSTGSHLHYEVIKSGERVDPKDYLTE